MAEGSTLQELFTSGWKIQRKVEKGELSSDDHKKCIGEGIQSLERATHQANELGLFSSNETIEEVATADLKYLLLPALLGDLTLQLSDEDRLENISKARVYCVDYLKRCKSYAITADDPPQRDTATTASAAGPPARKTLEQMSAERTAKIARLKAQKEMEKKLQDLTERLSTSEEHRDEELVREHYLALLKTWVFKCQDNVHSIDQEVEILEMMKQRGGPPRPEAAAAPPPPRQPMKPVVITRDMIQNKVFGAGYPSLPTVSLEEFYQQQYEEQVEQHKREMSKVPKSRVPDEEEAEKKEEDEDSEEALKKARDLDDYKDDHRRGYGNRKNMG